MAKLKITKTEAGGQIHDRYTGPESINSAFVGGTGGFTSQTGRQIQPTVKVNSAAATTGSIIAQKGSRKFSVADENTVQDEDILKGKTYRISSVSGTNWEQFGAGINPNTNDIFTATIAGAAAVVDNGTVQHVGTCTLVNQATPSAPNTMSIQLTLQTIVGANVLAANVPGGATSTFITFTAGNVTGPIATPPVGSTIVGFTGNADSVIVTAIISAGNVRVSTIGNVAAQNTVSVSTIAYASKITNRFVWDYGTDSVSNNNGGYNHNKYRYHLAPADSTFVKVAYA